ncbi:hypothetical protein AB0L00_25285 [Actinoallomurus sp. NPDC052308]|uniref:hypothetical protein n=1 Tax=Actinoallomurus sp. NPDC052308 TaxID=3155530 RepID=UPI00344266BF
MNRRQAYLEKLSTELHSRGMQTTLKRARHLLLHVTNSAASALTESVYCEQQGDAWVFCWAAGQPIGPAENISAVADRIQYVLREVEP